MSTPEKTPSKEYIDETNQPVQLDHSRQFIEYPRFTISETGIALTNYDALAKMYSTEILQHVERGFELEYERFTIQLQRALTNENCGLFNQPFKTEYAAVNNELVELNAFLYTCYGLDLIGLINDRNRYQEQLAAYFHQPYI